MFASHRSVSARYAPNYAYRFMVITFFCSHAHPDLSFFHVVLSRGWARKKCRTSSVRAKMNGLGLKLRQEVRSRLQRSSLVGLKRVGHGRGVSSGPAFGPVLSGGSVSSRRCDRAWSYSTRKEAYNQFTLGWQRELRVHWGRYQSPFLGSRGRLPLVLETNRSFRSSR